MSYIDAGYAAALCVLVGYGATLWARRARLERAVARRPSPGPAEGS
ncbi:MAG: hypothetical protein KGJ77_05605 [Acidobacteriota bacterium]|nr:hypothetical protein [Acidobacteriota bacterium]